HYDVAACSFDEDFINSFRERMERPMQFVRSNGASEVLVPVIVGCELLIGYDAGLFEELQRELAAERPVIPVGRLGLAPT
ncbi:MAG: hypothetical protein HY515_04855, partial [Candidatus Aenigmarchaeota archaeon]|nr:hypothetical protein [Candidatus Aenigmarchaeota archaeon]